MAWSPGGPARVKCDGVLQSQVTQKLDSSAGGYCTNGGCYHSLCQLGVLGAHFIFQTFLGTQMKVGCWCQLCSRLLWSFAGN